MNEVTISTRVEVLVEVLVTACCRQCKDKLKVSSLLGLGGVVFLEAEPCQRCMGVERDEGYIEGQEDSWHGIHGGE